MLQSHSIQWWQTRHYSDRWLFSSARRVSFSRQSFVSCALASYLFRSTASKYQQKRQKEASTSDTRECHNRLHVNLWLSTCRVFDRTRFPRIFEKYNRIGGQDKADKRSHDRKNADGDSRARNNLKQRDAVWSRFVLQTFFVFLEETNRLGLFLKKIFLSMWVDFYA